MPGRPHGDHVVRARTGHAPVGRSGSMLPLLLLILIAIPSAIPALARPHGPRSSARTGDLGMRLPHTGSLLVDYYEAFLKDHDLDGFRLNVSARYSEGTLTRLVQSGPTASRRAAILALGLTGSFDANPIVGKALRDEDPVVRSLAESALWAIWFRADSPENNSRLEAIQERIARRELQEARELADELIARAPRFAEAYNQRAIANFMLGRLAESAEDCRKAIKLNPFHIGALSGLAQCEIRLGNKDAAIATFRKAIEVQPFNDGLKEAVAELEAER